MQQSPVAIYQPKVIRALSPVPKTYSLTVDHSGDFDSLAHAIQPTLTPRELANRAAAFILILTILFLGIAAMPWDSAIRAAKAAFGI